MKILLFKLININEKGQAIILEKKKNVPEVGKSTMWKKEGGVAPDI